MPRITYETEVLHTYYVKADTLDIIVDPIDNSLKIRIDGRNVFEVKQFNHLSIKGVTDTGDRL